MPAPSVEADDAVRVVEPERMPLLGLLLRGVLARRLRGATARARARRTRGLVGVRAAGMEVGVRFRDDGITVERDPDGADAHVEGELGALLDLVAGGPVGRAVLAGKIRVRGNPVLLLRMLSVLRSGAA